MSITAMKQAVQVLIDIETATDLKRLYRYDDEKRMAEVVEEAITDLRTAIQEAEACDILRKLNEKRRYELLQFNS